MDQLEGLNFRSIRQYLSFQLSISKIQNEFPITKYYDFLVNCEDS